MTNTAYPPLQDTLTAIAEHDTNYEVRYGLVLLAMATARACAFATGFRIDPAEPEWPVAYIELPTGQVSWHMPQHPREYDGHTTEEKYRRIAEYGTESRFRAGLAKLRDLGATDSEIGTEPGTEIDAEPGWWLACKLNGYTVRSGLHPSPADAVEALVRAVKGG